ncbi:BRO-N domain-containing protein [Streptomyces sp. NBC_01766]|uniref:BRO-N domain-containing protein n=1 Tax=Streptomyces sp. NBC_01766 TaxID=2975936 RepID=UPI002DDA9EEE|nr:BRO family protein [Streptomyces sp. NBC_01766]WSC24657.1 BRO family protein [Streptomyces sp. NBC_01766]
MSDHNIDHSKRSEPAARPDAIDISDFVYGATGARIRRLTMPDGSHWFPAVDVCKHLGYTTTRNALVDHVPEEHRDFLETVSGRHCLSIPAGREWRRDLQLINLQGVILLVNACRRPECRPFKKWVAEVIRTVQREGSYSLPTVEAEPLPTSGPVTYAIPEQVAEAIVRLEERNMRLDEEFAAVQRERLAMEREHLALQRETLSVQREMLFAQRELGVAQQATAQSTRRIADRLGERRPAQPGPTPAPGPRPERPTAEAVLASWKTRMSVTEDVWAVAVTIAPALADDGELRMPLESIAAKTGLSVHRVNECLRFMRKHACIHPAGASPEGAPVYVLNPTAVSLGLDLG